MTFSMLGTIMSTIWYSQACHENTCIERDETKKIHCLPISTKFRENGKV